MRTPRLTAGVIDADAQADRRALDHAADVMAHPLRLARALSEIPGLELENRATHDALWQLFNEAAPVRQAYMHWRRRVSFLAEITAEGARYGGWREEEEAGLRWAVLDRPEGSSDQEARDAGLAFAAAVGWLYFYQGPGRAFGADPGVQVSRTRVLVTHFTGLDI